MKIVIDIPKETYNEVCWRGLYLCSRDKESLLNAIKNGTPLPKEHGRLKDVDWIDNNCEHHYSTTDGSWCYAWRDIDNAPTIIERSDSK